MVQNIFFELSLVILIATVVSIVMKLLRQPIIMGYIITGIIAGPLFLGLVQSSGFLAGLSQVGIAFLLFVVGLNLNLKTLKEVGIVSALAGFGQVIATFLIAYVISLNLGFSSAESAFISMALAFSSTIIVVKMLSDSQELDSLHGKITVGILLVQDLAAVFILMFLFSSAKADSFPALLSMTLIKGAALVALLVIAANYIMPRIIHFIAKSQELLFLFSISWVMAMSTILFRLGFTIEIGALFAGLSLASSPNHYEMSSKIKPLRDFFIILFFVTLGSQMAFSGYKAILAPIAALSLFVLVGKTLIILMILGFLGYHRKVGFSTGLSLAQISEFSLILVLAGQSAGYIRQEIVSIITIVGLLTIAGSAYLMSYSDRLYKVFSALLKAFEGRKLREEFIGSAKNFKIVLFGYNRIGYSLLSSFRKIRKTFLVVDFNPEIIKLLREENVPHKYGDAGDIELLDELNFKKIEMAISTIPDIEANLLIIRKARSANGKAVVIITTHQIDDAFRLYEAGADYVILPHFLGGVHASALIEKFGTNVSKFIKEKYRHLEELQRRKFIGHEHPRIHH